MQRLQHDDVGKEAGLGGMGKDRDGGVLETLLAMVTAREKNRGLLRNLQNNECISMNVGASAEIENKLILIY